MNSKYELVAEKAELAAMLKRQGKYDRAREKMREVSKLANDIAFERGVQSGDR